jgi:hypothetical protein
MREEPLANHYDRMEAAIMNILIFHEMRLQKLEKPRPP